jgi:flagellar basal-body rod protein FlgB
MRLFEGAIASLDRAMDVREKRHARLASNVANIDTPGFRPLDVDFAASMKEGIRPTGMAGAHDAHFTMEEEFSVEVIRGAETTPTIDGNTVDLDKTMASLAENGMQYSTAARVVNKKLALLRYVSSDGAA